VMMEEGSFRPELFYRIAALRLKVPSLAERREEVGALAEYFLERACYECGRRVKELTPQAKRFLSQARFRGNVRELCNLMESVVAFVEEDTVTVSHLKELHRDEQGTEETKDLNLERAKRRLERRLIQEALTRYNTLDEAARALGIDRSSLWRKKKSLDGEMLHECNVEGDQRRT